MSLNLKTVIYDVSGSLSSVAMVNTYQDLGFSCSIINKSANELLIFHSQNKVDILIVNDDGIDKDRLKVVLEIIYNNFCKKILLVSDNYYANKNYNYIISLKSANFDLKLSMMLLDMKREINAQPSHNVPLIKSKIDEHLYRYKFSSRHAGFKYFSEAVLKAYLEFPYEYSTMNIYKEIATEHGKSLSAIEKSMRMALGRAVGKINVIPQIDERNKLKSELPTDLTNNTAISAIVGRLVSDKELSGEEYIAAEH